MAAAAKLVVAPSTPWTTTTTHHRATCAPLAASATTPVTVSLSGLQQKQQAAVVASPAEAVDETVADAPPASLASMWRQVQGADDWRGLASPQLHPVLRAEIVRYGELVAACYRSFDLNPRSRRYLNCKHGKQRMLAAVSLAGAGYAVTRYIYAAPGLQLAPCGGGNKSRWIGYVAVAGDDEAARLGRRDILVSFRGTVTGSEWLASFMGALAPARFDPADPRPDVRVEAGFLSLYTSDDASGRFTAGSCRNQLLSEVTRLISKYRHEEEEISITLAGHSMGSSLAVLLGYDLAELGLNYRSPSSPRGGGAIPVTVFSFAGPRVGNAEFRDRCDELGVKVLRVVNVNDPITKMPGFVFNESARALAGRYKLPWRKACYTHVGVELALDFFKAGDIACVHDLQAYIDHLLECCGTDIAGPNCDLVIREDEGVNGGVASLMLESWRWRLAAICAGELMQTLGI